MAAPAEYGCVINFRTKNDGVFLEIGPKQLETITSCINQWISNTKEPERTLSNHQNKLTYELVIRFMMQSAKNHPYWETKIGNKTTGTWADITCCLSQDGYRCCFIVRCTSPVITGNSVANPRMN